MYKFIFLIVFSLVAATVNAQQSPVKWNFTAKRAAAAKNKYELHMTALLPAGWHIYSQNTPEGGPEPTKITFANNALVVHAGKPKEIGKLVKKHDDNFGVDVLHYAGKVDFVQTVTVKGSIKTNVSGEVYYMICTDSKCLPPTTAKFNIALK